MDLGYRLVYELDQLQLQLYTTLLYTHYSSTPYRLKMTLGLPSRSLSEFEELVYMYASRLDLEGNDSEVSHSPFPIPIQHQRQIPG